MYDKVVAHVLLTKVGGAPCRTRAPHEGTGCIVRAQRNGGMAAVKRAEKSDLEAVFKKVNTTIVEGGGGRVQLRSVTCKHFFTWT